MEEVACENALYGNTVDLGTLTNASTSAPSKQWIWTKPQLKKLANMRKKGHTFDEIAKELGKTYELCYHKFKKLSRKYPKLKKWILSVKKRHDKFERLRSVKFDPSDEQLEEIANHSWSVKQMRRLIHAIRNGYSFEQCASKFRNPKRTAHAFKRKYQRMVDKLLSD